MTWTPTDQEIHDVLHDALDDWHGLTGDRHGSFRDSPAFTHPAVDTFNLIGLPWSFCDHIVSGG